MKTSLICVIVISICIPANSLNFNLPEDGRLNFTELGVKYGHLVEEHDVTTEDGYILTMFHIRGERKTPVFILHGIADSADTFIIRGKTSLAITLADAGYDIWIGNARGNKYGLRHVKLHSDDPEFWNYSFHETGYYDIPAMIDYVLETTGEKTLQTIAHSQGTTTHFVFLSRRPEYNKKIKIFIALAPVAFLADLRPPVSTIAKFGGALNEFFKANKVDQAFSGDSALIKLIRLFCSQDVLSYEICFLWTGLHTVGVDPKRFEPSFSKILIGHYPASTSIKNFEHVDQVAITNRFCEFDYGPKGNLDRYGYLVPPEYNLREVTTKVAFIHGENDQLSRPKDVEIQRTILPNIVFYHLMEDKQWSHIDFIWGNDMNVTLFPFLLDLLEKHN